MGIAHAHLILNPWEDELSWESVLNAELRIKIGHVSLFAYISDVIVPGPIPVVRTAHDAQPPRQTVVYIQVYSVGLGPQNEEEEAEAMIGNEGEAEESEEG